MAVLDTISIVVVTFLCLLEGKEGPCKGFPYGCCPHTKWDIKKETCIECEIGFYWENCSRACPYPLFGQQCRHECKCRPEKCNFMKGCTNNTCNDKVKWNSQNTNYTTNIKYIALLVVSSILGIILIAYVSVLIIDKRRNKTLAEYRSRTAISQP